jgi:DNA-binding transcriptional LysR family regulator
MTLEGIAHEVVQSLAQIHSILALVRAGTGLAVVPESARMMAMRGLTYREFDDANPVMAELFVVWNRENYNPLVPIIAQIATSAGELRRG